jgi:hypothetical protein
MKSFTLFQPFTLATSPTKEKSADIIEGVILCQKGPAEGHGFMLGDAFLDKVVFLCQGRNLKVRMDHTPQGETAKVLSIVGEAFNVRRDGDKVRGDVRLFDVPAKETLKNLARQASHLFGMSLEFEGKLGPKRKGGLPEMLVGTVDAVAFVDHPAAATTLLSEGVVDSPQNDMTVTIPGKYIEALGLKNPNPEVLIATIGNAIMKSTKLEAEVEAKEPATAKEAHDALAAHLEAMGKMEMPEDVKGVHEKATAALGYLTKLAAFDGEETPAEEKEEEKAKEEVKAEAGDEKKDEKKEEVKAEAKDEKKEMAAIEKLVNTLAVKKVTELLAKVAIRPVTADVQPEKIADAPVALSAEEKKIAADLNIDEKTYLAALTKQGIRLGAVAK